MISPSPSRLNPKRQQKYKRTIANAEVKQEFIKDFYQRGGKGYIEALQRYGVNEQGEPLRLREWVIEYAEAIADFRLSETYTGGCSQIGKTLYHTLLVCYLLTEARLNVLWSYDLLASLNIQVVRNFRPVVQEWLKKRNLTKKIQSDAQNLKTFQVLGATTQFTYVSVSKKRENDDGRASAGGVNVGFSADVLIKEERSQYPPGAGDPLNRRLDAARLPSRPIRELGTPGSGNGVEAEIKAADYHFYPHYSCPRCNAIAPLHPKGCLLKPLGGKYLSLSGRPLDWHVNQDGDAMFACSECGEELSQNTRIASRFKCLKTGAWLRNFLDSLPQGVPPRRIKVGIELSPLLREQQTNRAQELIEEGLNTFNTDDFQQQGLGCASESNFTGVTLDHLKQAIALPPPLGKPEFTLAGIDQGRNEYWLWKCAYYLPANWRSLSVAQVIEQSRRHVVFGGDVVKGEIPELIEDCDFGIVDNEPDISAAAELCSNTCLEMADQQSSQMDAVKEGIVKEGGNEHKCWKLRNEKFLKDVLHAFLMGKYHLPSEWEQWIGKPTERSPLVHLTAPSFDPSTGKWKRPKNHLDDLYYAAMFCEAAFYLYLDQYQVDTSFDIGEEREVYGAIADY